MNLISQMRAELSTLWRKAMSANNHRDREMLLYRYRMKYRAYKRHVKFMRTLAADSKATRLQH